MKGVVSGSAHVRYRILDHVFLSRLPAARYVSQGRFDSVAGNPGIGVLFTAFYDGAFGPSAQDFVGFRFDTGKGTQYGWARIETGGYPVARDVIRDYAWGDVGEAIRTGQRESYQPDIANSVPGSLGLLAFWSQGLDAWRVQRTPESN